MSKDPAVLIYFDKWISSTNGMKAHVRAWYMDLLLYQYDNPEGIPDDNDFIAGICRVLPSEYDMFKQMLKQMLEQKFELVNGKWINNVANEIISKRQDFKAQRAKSGNIGVIIKLAKTIKGFTPKRLTRLKESLFEMNDEEIEQAKNKQVLEQMLKLYVNVDEDVNKDIIIDNNTVSSYRQFLHLSISQEEFEKLQQIGYSQQQIDSILDSIENYGPNKKYKSLFLTAKKWLSKEHGVPVVKSANTDTHDESEEDRIHREWKAKNKTIPIH